MDQWAFNGVVRFQPPLPSIATLANRPKVHSLSSVAPIATKQAAMAMESGTDRDTRVAGKPTVFTLEAHLNSILDTVPDAMIVIDERGLILSFSAAAVRMFGYSEAELLGENISLLMPSPDRERHDHYLENYLATGERRIIGIGRITTARRRNGVAFPIDLHIGEA